MTLHIILWKWKQVNFREVYTSEHVNMMCAMIRRNAFSMNQDIRIVCVTDDAAGIERCEAFPLWGDHGTLANISGKHLPSCYRRLRIFDPAIQKEMGIKAGDRILSLDLDAVILGDVREVFGRKDKFVGWGVRGQYHARVFNGSFFQFNAGDLDEIWTHFKPQESPAHAAKNGFMGSDQGWLSYKLTRQPFAFGWQWPHLASYPREVKRMRVLDRRTRIVFFHGAPKPWHDLVREESPWIKRYWEYTDADRCYQGAGNAVA